MDLNNVENITDLWSLPKRPLPSDGVNGARIVVIVWLLVTGYFSWAFTRQGSRIFRQPADSSIKDGLKSITWCAILLSSWYFILVVDRWLHYEKVESRPGYIIVDAFFEPLDLVSSILMLWGTYLLVRSRVPGSFATLGTDFRWWVPVGAVVLLCYIASAYIILYFAEVGLWMDFSKLELINSAAKARDVAEKAMRALFLASTVSVLGFATFGWWKISRNHGDSHKSIVCLVASALSLLVRNAFALAVCGPKGRRPNLILPRDATYGLFGVLFLAFTYWASREIVNEMGNNVDSHNWVESDVRKFIIKKLEDDTQCRLLESPPFGDLLTSISEPAIFESITGPDTLSHSRGVSDEHGREYATAYITSLRSVYGEMNSRLGRNYENTRPQSVASRILNLSRGSMKGRNSAASRSSRGTPTSPRVNSHQSPRLGRMASLRE